MSVINQRQERIKAPNKRLKKMWVFNLTEDNSKNDWCGKVLKSWQDDKNTYYAVQDDDGYITVRKYAIDLTDANSCFHDCHGYNEYIFLIERLPEFCQKIGIPEPIN